jgi:hypothetical protein
MLIGDPDESRAAPADRRAWRCGDDLERFLQQLRLSPDRSWSQFLRFSHSLLRACDGGHREARRRREHGSTR